MADWLSGMLGGFQERQRADAEQTYAEGLRSRQREAAVLQTLSNSPDPEVRSLAIAGILDSAKPAKRKGGLSGWLGEVAQSPYLASIKGLSATVQGTASFPDAPTLKGYIPEMPAATGSAALPQQNPAQDGTPLTMPQTDYTETVVGKAPPESPISMDMRMQVGQAPPGQVTLPVERPRQFFPSAEDLAQQKARGDAAGDVEGEVAGLTAAGFSPEEARAMVKQGYARRAGAGSAAPYQSVAGETLVNGQWVQTYGTFDKTTGGWKDPNNQPLSTFRKGTAQPPSLGQMREVLARQLFGKPAAQLQGEELAQVVDAETQLIQQQSEARRLGQGIGALESPVTPQVSATTGIPVGTPGSAVSGQVVSNAADRTTRRTLGAVAAEITERIKPLLAVLPSQSEFGGTLAPGAVLAARRRTNPQIQQQVAALDSALNSVKTTLARARGDTRLSNADIQRIDAALASLEFDWTNPLGGDSRETALARLAETEANLRIVLQSLPPDPVVGAPPPGQAAPTAAPPPATPQAAAPAGGSGLDAPLPATGGKRWIIRNGQLVQE